MFMTKVLKVAIPALMASAVSVSAATLDFTAQSTVDAGFAGSNWTLTGAPTAPNPGGPNTGGAAAELAAVGLVGDFDGLGIADDEVGMAESLTLEFDKEVKLTNVYFLDLFISQDLSTIETALVSVDGGTAVSFSSYNVFPSDGGFGGFDTSLVGTMFTFFSDGSNDNLGVGDFALAGVTVAPVPLPAGILLLGTALGGLGLARRRKTAA